MTEIPTTLYLQAVTQHEEDGPSYWAHEDPGECLIVQTGNGTYATVVDGKARTVYRTQHGDDVVFTGFAKPGETDRPLVMADLLPESVKEAVTGAYLRVCMETGDGADGSAFGASPWTAVGMNVDGIEAEAFTDADAVRASLETVFPWLIDAVSGARTRRAGGV